MVRRIGPRRDGSCTRDDKLPHGNVVVEAYAGHKGEEAPRSFKSWIPHKAAASSITPPAGLPYRRPTASKSDSSQAKALQFVSDHRRSIGT